MFSAGELVIPKTFSDSNVRDVCGNLLHSYSMSYGSGDNLVTVDGFFSFVSLDSSDPEQDVLTIDPQNVSAL